MPLIWLTFLLFCNTCLVNGARRGIHSDRIPSNVKIYPKNELKSRKHLRLIPSNDEGSERFIPPAKELPPLVQHELNFRRQTESDDIASIHEVKVPPILKELPHRHKVLYQRALQKDYDYAQFGQPCKIFTVDELEAFLGVMEESIEFHEGESQMRMMNPQEKGEQLEQLFNHSKAICDFRNLLTCHKHFLTCACAHPSMGINREGVCGINIGHPCELSGRTLKKHGIPMMPEMSPVKCLLENSECVMESENDVLGGVVSPIRKICKCRYGFWGATCSRRHDPVGIKLVAPKNQMEGVASRKYMKGFKTDALSEEVDNGRPIWMNDAGVASGDYFMHPEEIRDKLVELMNQQEIHPPENRLEEANKLIKNMERDVDMEEMVVNELHLRELAHLNHGDKCDPERQVLLDNPPVAKDASHRWTEPHPQEIKSWQLGLLQQKQPLCNFYKLLRCNEATKVCECKPGLELDSKSGGRNSTFPCKIPLGHNCDEDFDPILEFDPLKNRKRFSEIDPPPSCVPGTECTEKPLFFQKKCWCSPQNGYCDKEKFDDDLYSRMVLAIRSRFTLKLGDSCDPKLHQRLLSYRNDEDPGHQKRLNLFTEVIDNPESRLCDIESYLNCSETSRTCECWKQLQPSERDDGEFNCVAMNMASCGRTFKYGKYIYSQDDAQLWQVEKTLDRRFLPGCVPGSLCTGGNNPEWAGRCLCQKSDKTGEICKDRKSILSGAFRANRIPQNDQEEIDVLRVFFDLNAQTDMMEQLMTSGVNDVCDSSIGLTLDRIMKFWKEIANSNDTDSERRTLPYYIAATKWTKYLVSTVQGNSASLCNSTKGLRCQRTTGRCGCHRGARWIGNKCYLELDEQCDHKPGADWVTTCMQENRCTLIGGDKNGNVKTWRCSSCSKKKKDGSCSEVSQYPEDEEDEDIWDTWNVKDDMKKKRKRLTELKSVEDMMEEEEASERKDVNQRKLKGLKSVEDMMEEEEPSEEKIVKKRRKGGGGLDYYDEEGEGDDYHLMSPRHFEAEVVAVDNIKEEEEAVNNDQKETKNYFVITPRKKGTAENNNGSTSASAAVERAGRNDKSSSKTKGSQKKTAKKSTKTKTKSKSAGDELNKRQKDAYVDEIRRMLKEILEYRNIQFGEKCINEDEQKLARVFPTLPIYDLDHLPVSIPMAYIILSRLYWKGISFCSRNQFLKCTSEEVCGCSLGFGLIEEEGECRLKEHNYCDRELINQGKRAIDFVPETEKNFKRRTRHPLFQCQKGTKCVQIDYGLPVCVKTGDLGEDGEPKVMSRNLLVPNDDFGRNGGNGSVEEEENSSDGKQPSGSSWKNEGVYSLGIALVVRLIISWAFV